MQLTQAPVMAFFKQGAETRITTDASPVGIGAVLEQKQADGLYRPVHYANRKLTPPESRYSQFEREALAVKWGCEKIFLYIHGNETGAETGASGTELPAPSETTDTPKEGASFEQDPMDGIQLDSQRQAVPSAVPERPESRPVRKRESPKWMKDFICQK